MILNNLLYRLAEVVAGYGEVTFYQIGDCMQDVITLEHTQSYADAVHEPQRLYFGVRPTGTALLYDAPNVYDMMRDFNRACHVHDWYELRYDPDDGFWFEPVKVAL